MEAEIFGHVTWWNACPQPARLLLLSAALPVEAAAFVAHSNAMESVPTLSAADTAAVVLLSLTHLPHHDLASRAALNTYTAHRLAHAFRSQRAAAGAPVDELLWHLPEVLAVHRELMRGLHPRAGRLRTCNVQPADRAAPYPPFAAVPSTAMSLFDTCNARTLGVFEEAEAAAAGGSVGEGAEEEESALDEDGALREEECKRLLSAPPPAPTARGIDARAVGPVARLAAWLAAHLLELHPFADGNGRLARILVDALLAAVHPLPVPLVPQGCSLQDARVRYLAALREVPPWGAQGSTGWALEPTALTDLVLGSLVASWRRLRGQGSACGP
jgi:fido (protein-threonine AMPylation protein)